LSTALMSSSSPLPNGSDNFERIQIINDQKEFTFVAPVSQHQDNDTHNST